jgi:hypothetical protein
LALSNAYPHFFKKSPVQIVILVSAGVMHVALSYVPAGHYRGMSTTPAHIEPLPLALGCGALVAAWLIYKMWSRHDHKS